MWRLPKHGSKLRFWWRNLCGIWVSRPHVFRLVVISLGELARASFVCDTVLPYFKLAAVAFWDHVKQQEPQVLAIYGGFVLSIILFFIVRK